MSEGVNWGGAAFSVHFMDDRDGAWRPVGGLYIFALLDRREWRPLYVGETDSFRRRFANHERWPEAAQLGATHVHVRAEKSAVQREILEE